MSEVHPETGPVASSPELADVIENSLEQAVGRLERSREFAKPAATPQVLELCRRLMMQPGGIERLYLWAPRLDRAGVFLGTDWQLCPGRIFSRAGPPLPLPGTGP